jgi:hypothetical protein
MKPILIDIRVVKKLGFLAALITVFAFAGGYLFGYQQAKVFYTTGDESGSLFSSINSISTDSDIEPQAPEIVDAGENKNADDPDNITPSVTPDEVVTKADAEITEENTKQDTAATLVATASPADNKPTTQITTDRPKKIKFSIQVGIYGSLKNAQKMKRKLQAKNLDAYISSFKNKDNKLRFNVRFGYFENLKFANIALDDYRNIKKGNGYVVNFSDKNIIHSDADDIEQIANEPTPVTKSVDAPVDSYGQGASQAGDAITTPEVLTESQDKSLVN